MNELARLTRRTNELIAEHTGQPVEHIEQLVREPRWWTPDEAVEFGIIDHVVEHGTTP